MKTAPGRVSREMTSATQLQKFQTDDVNQCLRNKSGSHGIPKGNLFKFTFFLVDFGRTLCSFANGLRPSNASSREEYILQIDSLRLHLTFVTFCLSIVKKTYIKM